MFFDVGVQHELGKGAVNAGHGPFQHHKACAGEFGGGFKIHTGFDTGDFKMLLWGEVEGARVAPTTDFDIPGFVRSHRHFIKGQIGDAHQGIAEAGVKGGSFLAQSGDFRFLFRHKCAQAVEFGVIAAPFGGARLFGGGVLGGLGCFGAVDRGAARLVQARKVGRHRGQATARQGSIKAGGVFADGADVVHGILLFGWNTYARLDGRGEEGNGGAVLALRIRFPICRVDSDKQAARTGLADHF